MSNHPDREPTDEPALARLTHACNDALAGFYPPGIVASEKPQFGRPDGEPPLHEDEHVAHVDRAPSDLTDGKIVLRRSLR